MQDNSNFYRLKSPRSARVEGHTGKVSTFLIFGVIFTAAFLSFLIYWIIKGWNSNWETYLCLALFTFGCSAFLGFGIYDQIKNNKKNEAESKLLKDCLCTDGIIMQCKNVRYETLSDSGTYYHKLAIEYSFTDDKNRLRQCIFTNDYSYDPEFYKGQHIMVAFNDTDSTILSEFSFIKEDEERFLQNESLRSADDFDGLNGRLLEIDTDTKIRSAELEHLWLWAAFALFIIVASFTIPISILSVPDAVMGKIIPDVFIILIIYLVPALLMALIASFIIHYFKLRRRVKRILNNEPNFVWGRIFASEKTYRGGVKKVVCYCYIDKDGNRFTKKFRGVAVHKAIDGKPKDVVVMYDKDGNSMPLYNYKFTDKLQSYIERIDGYDDERFTEKVLNQHGAFLIDGEVPGSVEITGSDTATVYCDNPDYYDLIIDEFSFYAEHICKFYDNCGKLIKEFPHLEIFNVSLNDIQPSQFYVDQDKISAVKSFIKSSDAVVIPLKRFGDRYISLDGHTRLALAVQNGYKEVKGFISSSDFDTTGFVNEAQKRKIFSPYDLKILPHAEYEVLWNKFCDEFLSGEE